MLWILSSLQTENTVSKHGVLYLTRRFSGTEFLSIIWTIQREVGDPKEHKHGHYIHISLASLLQSKHPFSRIDPTIDFGCYRDPRLIRLLKTRHFTKFFCYCCFVIINVVQWVFWKGLPRLRIIPFQIAPIQIYWFQPFRPLDQCCLICRLSSALHHCVVAVVFCCDGILWNNNQIYIEIEKLKLLNIISCSLCKEKHFRRLGSTWRFWNGNMKTLLYMCLHFTNSHLTK